MNTVVPAGGVDLTIQTFSSAVQRRRRPTPAITSIGGS
jgi:hypothetical protein